MVVPMYHPAAALHQPSLRGVVKEDFVKLPALIHKAKAARQSDANPDASQNAPIQEPADEDSAEQLSLF